MPAPRSSSGRTGGSGGRKSQARSGAGTKRAGSGTSKRSPSSTSKRAGSGTSKRATSSQAKRSSPGSSRRSGSVPASSSNARSGGASIAEQLANGIIKPLDLVLISRERIQQTLDEAAERGRVTRGDANELVLELVKRGRQQTDDLLKDIERLLGRGRDQLGTASKRVRTTEPVDRLVRSADRARRTMGVGPSFPVLGYDDLTAGQVEQRLLGLKPADLRRVRDYERRHANRKSVLEAIERELA
jgi:polyhydroxyalkanoate synthesis regulator phasin